MGSPIDWPVTHRRAWIAVWSWVATIWFVVFLFGLTRGERWWLIGFTAVMAYTAVVLTKRIPLDEEA